MHLCGNYHMAAHLSSVCFIIHGMKFDNCNLFPLITNTKSIPAEGSLQEHNPLNEKIKIKSQVKYLLVKIHFF